MLSELLTTVRALIPIYNAHILDLKISTNIYFITTTDTRHSIFPLRVKIDRFAMPNLMKYLCLESFHAREFNIGSYILMWEGKTII